MISFRAMAIGTLFTAEREMTRSTEIEGLIGSGETKETIFFAALVPAQEQTMAATESKEAAEMTPLQGPTKETVFMVDLEMIHFVARLMLTNYSATGVTTSSMEENHTITSLVAQAQISTTSKNHIKHMSTKMRFISAMDIQFSTPRKALSHRTHSNQEAH